MTTQLAITLIACEGRHADALRQLRHAAEQAMPSETLMRRVATVAETERELAVARALLASTRQDP